MRRLWIILAVGAAGVVIALVLVREAGDDGPIADMPPPAACEPDARDLNPRDRPIEPSRGERLIPRVRGHLPVGFNDSAFLAGQVNLEQTVELYEAANATIWRLPLDWGQVESSPGEVSFARYDEIYCAAVAAGIRPLWHLTGVPGWAAPLGTCNQAPCVRPPEDEHLPQLRRFAELAAIRYPRSAAFEVWNEPNLNGFWGGLPDPGAYLKVLEAIYDGTKDGNPKMPVLGGALSNNPTDLPSGRLSLHTFLGAMIQGGALDHMDALGLHAYPLTLLGEEGEQFTPALATARSLLAGEPGVRIWVTEIGAPTEAAELPQVTPEQQAAMMTQAYVALDRSQDADAVVFHTLLDPTPEIASGPGFGFFTDPDEADTAFAKPVVCQVLRASGAGQRCPEKVEL